jgi:hypothetical protein
MQRNTGGRWAALAAACCALLAMAAVAQDTLRLPMPWSGGLRVAYHSETVQETRRAGGSQRLRTSEALQLEIAEHGPAGTLQVWRTLDPSVEASGDADTLAQDRALVTALATRFAGMPFEAELNAKGEFQGLRNWEALGAAMREVMLPALVANARKRPGTASLSEAELRARYQPVLERLSGREATNASLGRQARIYNYFVGAALRPGQARNYEDSTPSPWSADVIPTRGRFELGAVDAATATIRWTQDIDAAKALPIVLRNLEAVGAPAKAPPPGALPPGVRIADRAKVVMDRRSGLPILLEHRREVEFNGASTVSQWTLRRVSAKAVPGR